MPASLVPGIEKRAALPNTLYSLYQTEYGINIVSAQEELSAVAATAEDETTACWASPWARRSC